MSAFASTLHTRSGPVFVKGTLTDALGAWTYRHEADVTQRAPLAPPLLWHIEAGGWTMYGYGWLDGRHPDLAPDSPDLPFLVDALTALATRPWPSDVNKKPLAERLRPFTPRGEESALDGRALTHTDLNVFNLLVTDNGLRILDWAMSCPGPDWTDAALTVPRLITAGHTVEQAIDVMEQVPAYAAAPPRALAVFAQAIYAFWDHRTCLDPLPQRVELTAAAKTWMLTANALSDDGDDVGPLSLGDPWGPEPHG